MVALASWIGAPVRKGARLAIVELGESDRPAIERHVLALGHADRVRRFRARRSDVALALYAGRIDFARTYMVGALDGPSRLVGLAETQLDHEPGRGRAGIAVSIEAPFRGMGLGRQLLALVMDEAFARGAPALEFRFAPGDPVSLRLAAALGAEIDLDAGYALLTRPARRGREAHEDAGVPGFAAPPPPIDLGAALP